MSQLPPGYRTTTAAGLTVLWRDTPDGQSHCVTIATDPCQIEPLAEIAARDAMTRGRAAGPATRKTHP